MALALESGCSRWIKQQEGRILNLTLATRSVNLSNFCPKTKFNLGQSPQAYLNANPYLLTTDTE